MISAAFYLPQYHPVPENDAWWGAGFTEWRNVVQARPLFRGHQQPHLPADLGFYDLRLPEVRQAQADLALEYGIDAFCYYHYWFNGRRILERPFSEVLDSGQPSMPFMLCWANENWTRRWDGQDHDRLLTQVYGPEDDLEHIRHLAGAFADPRYVRVDGKAVFLVYRASHLPDARRTTDLWRAEASKLGIGELLLLRVEGHAQDRGDPRSWGFDGGVEFQPDWTKTGPPAGSGRLRRRIGRVLNPRSGYRQNSVYGYEDLMRRSLAPERVDYPRFRCAVTGWDNSARRKTSAAIFRGSTPELFEEWVRTARAQARAAGDDSLFFVNAWNEWAEGAHLEPDLHGGHATLQAYRRALAADPAP